MDAVLIAVGVLAAVAAVGVPVLAARQQRRLQQRGRGIKGGAGVVDELWRPTEHAARIVQEERRVIGDPPPAPGGPPAAGRGRRRTAPRA